MDFHFIPIVAETLGPFRPHAVQNSGYLLLISDYRGFLPYATFGTWKKFAFAKNRISKIFILCMQ